MKLLPALFIAVILLASCGKDKTDKDSHSIRETDKTGTKSEPENPDNTANAQTSGNGLRNISYEPGRLPASVKYGGRVVAGATWEDNNGRNLLIITETEEVKQKEDFRMKELFAYQFIVNGEETRLLWRLNDLVKDCPVDITLNFIPKSLTITDLDNNGIAENTLIYKMSCKGDVSPDDMKLIMHEAETKYAIRGMMLLETPEGKFGNDMKVDPSFDKAPKEFLPYAKDEWEKFKTEKLGN
jgi:hypothetical protein